MTTPQFIVQDFGGSHSGDLQATRSRLVKGGSYKRQRIVLIMPAVVPIQPKVYLSHCSLGFPPNNGVFRILGEGMEVGDAYSNALLGVLSHPELSTWEYVLTLEADNTPPSDGVVALVEDLEQHPELAAIGGLYFTKGPGGCAQIWGSIQDPIPNFRPQVPVPDSVQECCGLGMGFTLFRLSMFKDERLRRPWFKTLSGKSGYSTQDLYFWSDARKFGYRCAVDTRVRVGHLDAEGKFGPAGHIW
jgi:hypothetical protein